MKDDCVFCKIIKGEIPNYTIYEDKDFKVFLDINPITNGHALLVPKTHYENMFELDEKMVTKIFKTAKKVYDIEKDKINLEGYTLIQNNGHGQDVKHYHLHLIPRYTHDDVKYNSNEKQLVEVENVFNQIKE